MNDVLALLFMLLLVVGLSTKSAQVTTKPVGSLEIDSSCCGSVEGKDGLDQ
ncbi:MAG: hypothetical protein GXW86_01220 [Firmicutes bacterium]|nr:hypothetical protein [Candidatus Fermentithermobacillaceae bacterium]